MDRDFKAAYLEGQLAGLDEALRVMSPSPERDHVQASRRETQAELDALSCTSAK